MQTRVDLEGPYASLGALSPASAYIDVPIAEFETPVLPRDHPAWMRDAVAVSSRAREWLERLKPVVVRVLNFWDHSIRSIRVMGSTLTVDPSGSYRID